MVFSRTLERADWADSRIARGLIHQPVELGAGLPLFKELDAPLRLALIDATRAAPHVYRPAPARR